MKPSIHQRIITLISHHTETNPIHGHKIAQIYGIKNTRDVRDVINHLRCHNVPVCSSKYGYWMASSQCEIDDTIVQLTGRIQAMLDAISGLRLSNTSSDGTSVTYNFNI